MKPRNSLRVILSIAAALALWAAPTVAQQTGTVQGTVTDASTARPLPGAQITIVGTQLGTISNAQGRFLITNVPAGQREVRVQLIGYGQTSQTVTVVAGGSATATFQLAETAVALQELVVTTALGIERQARELAYSVSTVGGDELTRARETNIVNSLAGRTPGIEVIGQSGNIGGSSRIVIRGLSSLSGDNQPLFVIDGVPIFNSNIVAGTSQDRLTGAVDVGNRAADLNPDDIESVTVLRGAAAAALYGQRAKDGVILITTRRGSAARTQTVTASTSLRWSNPLVLPDFQNEYAQGGSGGYSPTSLNGWGPRISGQRVANIRGDTITLQPFPNNVRDFYERGQLAITSVSFSAGGDNADFRLGVTRQDEGGILPNSEQGRTSLNINSGYTLNPQLRARLSGFYTTTDSRGRAVAGGNNPNVLTSIINTLPRTFDTDILRDYRAPDGSQRALSNFTNNPFWVAYENVFTTDLERIFGNAQLDFSPLGWMTVTGRVGLDNYTENRRNVNEVGTIGRLTGLFSQDVIQERQLNVDIFSEARRTLTEDINIRGVLGFNANEREQQIQRNSADQLLVPGLFNFGNAVSNAPANSFSQRRLYGVYGDVTFGFREYLFLNLTGRNDWSSTLPVANRSFFYPSANVSFVFTEALNIPTNVLTYGKLRANLARVGSDEDPYQLDFRFFPVQTVFGQYSTTLTFPFGGQRAFNATATIPPANLRPQTQESFEIGTELGFLNGRALLDLTYYDVRTSDQIISIPVPQSTGFAFNRTNVGEVSNRGIEAQLTLSPVRTRALNWETVFNYTRNQNRVESLAPGLNEIVIASAFNALQVRAEPGQSLGLYGPRFLRAPDGQYIINAANGLREVSPGQRLGSIDPDFRLTVNNRFGFGPASLSFLVDWRKGGIIFSNTIGELRRAGLAEETAVNRDGSMIDVGVIRTIAGGDTTYRANDVPVNNMQAWWAQYSSASLHEGNIFDATNVRLRELRVDYTVPTRYLGALPISTATIGLEGRNLFIFHKRIPHIDPEVGLFGSASNGQGVEWNVLPSTRSFGVNFQVGL